MRRFALIAAVVLASPALADSNTLHALATMMQGKFVIDDGDTRMTDRRVRIEAPDIGNVVFYLQLNQGPELALYRQRILLLEAVPGSDEVVQRAYSLIEPERFVDAEPSQFLGLSRDDIERILPDGCEQVWTRAGEEFQGYTDPARCTIISSRTGIPRRIEAVTSLTATTLSLVERGFDEDGRQLFGTKPGESFLPQRID